MFLKCNYLWPMINHKVFKILFNVFMIVKEVGALLVIRNNFEYKRIVIDNICGIYQVFVLTNYNC